MPAQRPQELLLIAYDILVAAADPRAPAVLQQAWAYVQEEAAKLADPRLRDEPWAGLGLALAPAVVDGAVDVFVTPQAIGAMALFGEKYGESVRVIQFGPSVELCGGTHVTNTAEVGIFAITSEGSSAANVRRIEAITGAEAIDWHRARVTELAEVGALLGDPRDPVAAARRTGERLASFEAEAKKEVDRRRSELAVELAEAVGPVGSGEAVISEVPVSNPQEIIGIAKSVQAERPGSAVVLGGGTPGEGRAGLVALIPGDAYGGISAADLIAELASLIGGGGGGSDELAQAGGGRPEGVSEALVTARARLESA